MSQREQQLPRMTMHEMFAISALNKRKECLKAIPSPRGRAPDATDLALALQELDDVTLQWALKKYFTKIQVVSGGGP